MAHSRSENHGFPLLQQGEEIDNWGNVVREEAFIPLEERLLITDTSTNRSNYVSYQDLLYYETDTGKFFEGNGQGSGWSETQLESRLSSVESTAAGKADDPHGNEDHDETYETEGGAQSRVDSHEADTGGVHGVSGTDSVAGKSDVDAVASDLSDHEGASNPHSGSASNTDLNNHESSTGDVHGVAGADSVAGQSDVDSTVESHRQNDVHDSRQPNQTHGNEDHHETYETEAGAQGRVNSHESSTQNVHGVGANDVASTADVSDVQASSDVSHDQTQGGTGGTPHDHADPDDPVTQFGPGTVADGEVLKNEGGNLVGASAGGQIESYATVKDLPDPESLSEPTIAYVEDKDDYIGVFQS